MKRSLFFIVLVAIIYSGTTLMSCKKNGSTVAAITVLDSVGAPAPNAAVTLWQDTARNSVTGVQGNIRVNGITSGSGTVQFTFANEAFLNILAIKGVDTAYGRLLYPPGTISNNAGNSSISKFPFQNIQSLPVLGMYPVPAMTAEAIA